MDAHRPEEVIPAPLARAVADVPWWFVIGGQAVRCFCPYRPSRDVDFGVPSVETEIETGQTVEEVLQSLGVPPDQTRIIFVNNRAATLAQPLQGGERLGVFPAVGGG